MIQVKSDLFAADIRDLEPNNNDLRTVRRSTFSKSASEEQKGGKDSSQEFWRKWDSSDKSLTIEDVRKAISLGYITKQFIKDTVEATKEDLLHSLEPSLACVTTAAFLAKLKLLSRVEVLKLFYIDLSSIPGENIAALCSVARELVSLDNVTGCINTIFSSVKCKKLEIFGLTLDKEAMECLVKTMRMRVREVGFFDDPNEDMDIEVLTNYDGTGSCCLVNSYKHRAFLHQWAGDVCWKSDGRGLVCRD